MKSLVFTLLPLLVSAHFKLDYPPARGFDEDLLGTFPCGSQDTVSPNRTAWPVNGGPIDLDMGHTRTLIEVFLGLGNDVGSDFNITVLKTIEQEGLNDFCLSGIIIPDGVATVGMNATIQVVTNNDDGNGGLYNCADITFVAANSPDFKPPPCSNSTGVEVVPYTGTAMPNASMAEPSSSGSAAPKATGAAGSMRGSEFAIGGVVAFAFAFAAAL